MSQDWKNNPKLSGVDKSKLDMLQALAEQGAGKSASEMLPFLMNAARQGKNNGLKFSSDEVSLILEAIKMGKSKEEIARLDKIVNMMRMMH